MLYVVTIIGVNVARVKKVVGAVFSSLCGMVGLNEIGGGGEFMSLLTAFVATFLAVSYVASFFVLTVTGLRYCKNGHEIIGLPIVVVAASALIAPTVYMIGN